MPLPFSGLRILDLAGDSASLASRVLADLGADVIRVEPPHGGRLRALAPFLGGQCGPERSLHHLYFNAGKRSVIADLATEAGRGLVLRLAATADALIETGAPGEMTALGLGFEALTAVNPGIIVASVTPFGQDGEWARWKGNDLVSSAASGLLHVTGEPDGPPAEGGADPAYRIASLAAAAGITLALHAREHDPAGRGVHLDISIQECARMTILEVSNPNLPALYGRVPQRPGQARGFRCADGKWVGVNVRPDRFARFLAWAAEARVATDLTEDDWHMAGLDASPGERARVNALVEQLAMSMPRDAFVARALVAEQMCLPILAVEELGDTPHLQSIDAFVSVPGALIDRPASFPRSPVDGYGGVTIRRAPLLGEHTGDVIAAVGQPLTLSLSKDATGLEQVGLPPGRPIAPPPSTGVDHLHTPLAGLRVIDFTWVLAGPLGTRILANFGADVIKVESRVHPDSIRSEMRPVDSLSENTGALFAQANTGKRSVSIDLKTAAGRDLVRRLIATADVVVNNYRPGVMERFGLDYEALRALNPRVILVNIPGCGREGPWAGIPTMGNLIMGASGLNALTGFPGDPPRGVGTAYPDFITPYITVTTVLAALREREVTGLGREINLNQLAMTISLLGVEWLEWSANGRPPVRRANRDPNCAPHGVYPTAGRDEWLALAVESDAEWAALAALIGLPYLADDPRFASLTARKENEDALDAIVASWAASADKWDLAALLQSRGIAAAPVEDLSELLARDPEMRTRHHFQSIEAPPSDPNTSLLVDGEAIRFAGVPRALERHPMLGEHSESVLSEILGLSEAEYDALVVRGVIN